MIKEEHIKAYCLQHNLNYADHAALAKAYSEEDWKDVKCAGFDGHVGGGGQAVIVLHDNGTCEALFYSCANDPRFVEDKFVRVLDAELGPALAHFYHLHIKE
jgi:hypothetical protein